MRYSAVLAAGTHKNRMQAPHLLNSCQQMLLSVSFQVMLDAIIPASTGAMQSSDKGIMLRLSRGGDMS